MKNTVLRVVLAVGLTGLFGAWVHAKAIGDSARKPVVLELFTSEGSSSCPPADKLLQSLDESQPFPEADLIVLSEHVDYWNHDGWADPYSSHLFSARQLWYAEQFGLDDGVYTPQAVVDGQQQTVGSNAAAIRSLVAAATRTAKVPLQLTGAVRQGDQIKFRLTSANPQDADGSAIVYVALAENRVRSKVGGGENDGRSLTHVAVVRVFATVGSVRAGSTFSKDITIAGATRMGANGIRLVAFLQKTKSHRIVAAAVQKM